jgi:hypothetical protein
VENTGNGRNFVRWLPAKSLDRDALSRQSAFDEDCLAVTMSDASALVVERFDVERVHRNGIV